MAEAGTTQYVASCRCGKVGAVCSGDPVRVSVCHCLDCQRRSGSAFAFQARWPDAQVRITGEPREWVHVGESGARASFRFCGNCGGTIAYVSDALPGLTAIPAGTFADPHFPRPEYSVYEARKHAWVAVGGDAIDHFD